MFDEIIKMIGSLTYVTEEEFVDRMIYYVGTYIPVNKQTHELWDSIATLSSDKRLNLLRFWAEKKIDYANC